MGILQNLKYRAVEDGYKAFKTFLSLKKTLYEDPENSKLIWI